MTLLSVRVERRVAETEDIAVFELRHPAGAALPAFGAGAHVDVHLPGGLIRQYSICNSPAERHRYVLGVLRTPDSRGGSKAVHEGLREGQCVTISEPRNHFALAPAGRYILLAGGIGITPLLSMAEALADAGQPFEFHYCARTRAKAAFRRRLEAAQWRNAVHLHFDDESDGQKLNLQRVIGSVENATRIYVCGPSGFIAWIRQVAAESGWPGDRIHVEHFNAPPADDQDGQAFSIRLRSSGEVIPIAASESILDALRNRGLDVPSSCEQGVCGTCLTGVLEGQPDHRDVYLSEAEKAKGDQIALCCSRAKSPLLVLDL